MNSINAQFGNPTGFVGRVVGNLMAYLNKERIIWTLEMLNVQSEERVLEIGFGPGVALHQISREVPDAHLAGVDHSEVMLQQATRRNFSAVRQGRVELKHASVTSLPFDDGVFDKVFAINSMHHWPQPVEKGLREVHRVLKSGGLVLVAEQPRWVEREDDIQGVYEEIVAHLSAVGFDSFGVETKSMQPVTSICVLGRK